MMLAELELPEADRARVMRDACATARAAGSRFGRSRDCAKMDVAGRVSTEPPASARAGRRSPRWQGRCRADGHGRSRRPRASRADWTAGARRCPEWPAHLLAEPGQDVLERIVVPARIAMPPWNSSSMEPGRSVIGRSPSPLARPRQVGSNRINMRALRSANIVITRSGGLPHGHLDAPALAPRRVLTARPRIGDLLLSG